MTRGRPIGESGRGVSAPSTWVQEPMSTEESQTEERFGEQAWRDEETLQKLYVEEGLSTRKIADKLGCHNETVRKWLGRHGVEVRTRSEANEGAGRVEYAGYRTDPRGYEVWSSYDRVKGCPEQVRVHRLVAVSKFGFGAVCGKAVHHRNGVKWDNRPSNLQVVTNEEHTAIHHTLNSGYYTGGLE